MIFSMPGGDISDLESKDVQEFLLRIIKEYGKDIGKELGRTLSTKELVSQVKPKLIESLVKYYSNILIEEAKYCRTSYCLAMKLSSIYSQIRDLKELLDHDPNSMLQSVLFNDIVLSRATTWPIDFVIEEIEKPQFANLKDVEKTILRWLIEVEKRRKPFTKKEEHIAIPVSVSTMVRSSESKEPGTEVKEGQIKVREELSQRVTSCKDQGGKITLLIIGVIVGLFLIILGLLMP